MSRKRAILVILVIVIVGGVCLAWHYRPPAVFYRRYQAIKLDMTSTEVENLFKHSFDLTCTFRECTVGYISRGSLEAHDPAERNSGAPIESVDQIPWFYDNAQFLFDAQGKLVAYTWNGEELHVHTTIGEIEGTSLSQLTEEQWKKITGE